MVKTKNCLLTAAAVSAALVAQSAAAFEFHGYFRGGAGASSEGGDQVCFQLPGAGADYRLGNECENYGELIFQETVYEGDDGSEFGVEFMYKWNDPGNAVVGEGNADEMAQAWGYARNVAGGIFEGAQFWAGERYYMRRDVHINDYFYWNTQNSGGGVEDIAVGDAKFAYAYLRPVDGNTPSSIATTLHDLRLYELDVNPGGSLMLGAQLTTQSAENDTADDGAENGYMLNIEHTQDNAFGLGGFNRLALQYASGSSNLGGGVWSTASLDGALTADVIEDFSGYQIVEQLVWNNDTVSGQATFVWRDRDFGSNAGTAGLPESDEWMSAGVRPIFHINKYFNIATELGYDQYDPEGGDSRDLTKFTIAPEITPDTGFFSRPALRAFVTYANWNDAARDASAATQSGPYAGLSRFNGDTDGMTYGVQVEAWW